MPSGPYERFYPGEDKGLLDPTWGGGANDAAIAIEWLSKKDPQALLDALDTLLEQYDSRFDDKRYWYEDIETKQDFLVQLREEITN